MFMDIYYDDVSRWSNETALVKAMIKVCEDISKQPGYYSGALACKKAMEEKLSKMKVHSFGVTFARHAPPVKIDEEGYMVWDLEKK